MHIFLGGDYEQCTYFVQSATIATSSGWITIAIKLHVIVQGGYHCNKHSYAGGHFTHCQYCFNLHILYMYVI